MERLDLIPSYSGYNAQPGDNWLSVKLDGGLSRTRLDILNAANGFNCTWDINPEDYQYLAAFYRVFVRRQETFLLSLLLNDSALEDYECKFLPNTWKLNAQQGLSYTVAASIEGVPVTLPNAEADDLLIELRILSASYWNSYLDITVNQELPPQISMAYREDLDYAITVEMPES